MEEKHFVLVKKKLCPECTVTGQRVEDIQVGMEISPRKLSRQLAQKCNILKSSVLIGLKSLKFHPFKMLLVQKLNSADPVVHIIFCCWMLQSVHDRIVHPVLLFMSDEACFRLSGFMNAQNTHH